MKIRTDKLNKKENQFWFYCLKDLSGNASVKILVGQSVCLPCLLLWLALVFVFFNVHNTHLSLLSLLEMLIVKTISFLQGLLLTLTLSVQTRLGSQWAPQTYQCLSHGAEVTDTCGHSWHFHECWGLELKLSCFQWKRFYLPRILPQRPESISQQSNEKLSFSSCLFNLTLILKYLES